MDDRIEGADENALYRELAQRAREPVAVEAYELPSSEDLRDMGERIFQRLSPAAWQIVCGEDGDDVKDRGALMDAFGIGGAGLRTALANALVVSLGLTNPVASVVAMLVMRLFLKPGYEATCAAWKERLPK